MKSRTITWEEPGGAAAEGLAMTGLEYLRAMADGRLPGPPIGATMGMMPGGFETGRAVFFADPGEYHYNPIGTVHGGLAATLLDSAMSCAVHTTLAAGDRYTTLELKVNFVRPIAVETGRVRAGVYVAVAAAAQQSAVSNTQPTGGTGMLEDACPFRSSARRKGRGHHVRRWADAGRRATE